MSCVDRIFPCTCSAAAGCWSSCRPRWEASSYSSRRIRAFSISIEPHNLSNPALLPYPMSTSPVPSLTPVEARVLGVLAEKQRTVPDSYPMTLKAVVSGCNQKTSRDPVMEVSDTQAQEALDNLRGMNLA